MPQVIPAVATATAEFFTGAAVTSFSAAAGTASFAVVGSYAAGYLAATAAVAYGFAAISRAVTRRPSVPSLRAMGTEVNVRDPAAARQIIYGQRRVSGVFYPVGTSGTNNQYLHVLLLIAGHECEELGDVTFNDEVVPLDGSGNATGRYAGFVRIKKHLGTYNQTVDTDLQTDLGVGFWSNNHKLQGIAYLYLRLKVSADLFPGGIPEVYCLVKGRKLYDPRNGAHSLTDASTWTYSANAALCLADWLRGVPTRNTGGTIVRNHGVGAADDEIDWTEVTTAANICDESVVLADASTENRYEANGVMLSSTLPADGIELVKSAMAGDCVYVGGKWLVLAGAYRTPTLPAFDDGDLRKPLSGVRLKPAITDLYNVGRGLYVSADNNWQPTDIPQVRNSTYITQDAGELPLDMEFHFTTSPACAQRLLKIIIERSRQGIAFVAPCKLNALQVRTGDVIPWTDSDLGWSSKPFEVLGVALVTEADANGQPYLGVDLTLRETASGVWDWANGEETTVDIAPNTTLLSPFDIANPTSLTVTNAVQQQADGTTVPRLLVAWTAPDDANVTTRGHIRIEYKLNAASDWLPVDIIRGDIVSIYILAVVIGQSYDVRVRSENDLIVSPSWVTVSNTTVTGDTTAPGAPTGLVAVTGTGKAVSLDWDDSAEDDLNEYGIYRSSTSGVAGFSKIAEVRASRFVDVDVTIGTQYWYKVTAFDGSENESAASGVVTATPGTVGSSAVDSTAPSAPAAPTLNTSGTYMAGDGTVFSRLVINVPAMPTGGVVLNVLYRRNGTTGWIVADQRSTGGGSTSIDDLTPGVQYEVAAQAFSVFGYGSTITSATGSPFTAPNKTGAPNTPSGVAYVAGNSASYTEKPVFGANGLQLSCLASWEIPTDKDVVIWQWVTTTTDTDAAADAAANPVGPGLQPNYVSVPRVVLSQDVVLSAQYFRVRAINSTGVASSWGGGGTDITTSLLRRPTLLGTTATQAAAGNDSRITGAAQAANNLSDLPSPSTARTNLGLGTAAVLASTAVAQTANNLSDLTNASTARGSLDVLRSKKISHVANLTGGAAAENFTVNHGFGTNFSHIHVQCVDGTAWENLDARHDYANGSNDTNNTVIRCRNLDGTNLAGGNRRFTITFFE